MRIDINGRLGIGTPHPDHLLQIHDGNTPTIAIGKLNQTTMGRSRLQFYAGDGGSANGFGLIYHKNASVDRLGFVSGDGREMVSFLNGGRVGIGTNSPQAVLEVNGDANIGSSTGAITGYGAHLNFLGAAHNGDGLWLARYNNGSNQTELRVNIGDDVGQTEDMFVVGTHFWNGGTWFPHFSVHASGNVGIGTTKPQQKLHVKGTIYSTEVKVDVAAGSGPDYVFANDYKLLSLEEIKAYIDQNKHLPEIPSAKEMEANGLNLGEMNLLLLKKIEELTLHLINRAENDRNLRKEIDVLKEEVAALKEKSKCDSR
jgi:hypothetical protein